MTRQWIVRPLAQADLDDAATWYEGQQSGLGSRFLDAVDHVFSRVRETPLQFPSVSVRQRQVSICAMAALKTSDDCSGVVDKWNTASWNPLISWLRQIAC